MHHVDIWKFRVCKFFNYCILLLIIANIYISVNYLLIIYSDYVLFKNFLLFFIIKKFFIRDIIDISQKSSAIYHIFINTRSKLKIDPIIGLFKKKINK